MKKLITMVGILLAMGSAQADIWLDGQLTEDELFAYNTDVFSGDNDMNGLYEFGGNYFDTLVDTTVNINNNSLFEDGTDTTYYTNTGAATIYQAHAGGSTIADVMQYYVAAENRNIGFNAEILRGTDRKGDRFEYRELANGMYQNTSDTTVRSKSQIEGYLKKFSNFDIVTVTDKWGTRERPPVEWVGITEAKLLELNGIKSFTVQAGNGKWKIANALGMTMQELYDANPGLESRTIKAGEVFTNSSFKQGDHIKVKDWDATDVANGHNAHIKDKSDKHWDAVFADAPTTASSKRIGYVVQSGNTKGTVMDALGVSKATLNDSNEDFEFNWLKAGQFVVSGEYTPTDGIIGDYEGEKAKRDEAKRQEEANRKAEADRLAQVEADRIAQEEADRKARAEADRKAKEEASKEADRLHRETGKAGDGTNVLQSVAIQFNQIELGNLSNTFGQANAPLPNIGATIPGLPSFLID